MARSVLEAVAKHKGITKGGLKSKIDALHAAGHISEAMSEAAHEIRLAGSEAAHEIRLAGSEAAHEIRLAGSEAAHGDLVAEQLKIEDADTGLSETLSRKGALCAMLG